MLLGLALLYVGAVLCLNGIWLTGRIADREITIINLCVAGISSMVALHTIVMGDTIADTRTAAMTLLFAITYLWVAYNRITECDGRGLGWFSLFVTITVTPMAVHEFINANSVITYWMGFSWSAWAALWLLYFLQLTGVKNMPGTVAAFTLFCGIFTAWLPGMLVLFELA